MPTLSPAPQDLQALVPPELVDAFEADGVVCLRGVLRPATLEFVAGSHEGPWLMPRTFMSNEAKWFPEGSLADLPDIEADRSRHRILGWALEPGDAVAFNMLTLHASAGVEPGRRRRVFSVRMLGDDMRHAPRRWKTSPDFPGLAEQLPPGAPMAHPLFPVLWPREAAALT